MEHNFCAAKLVTKFGCVALLAVLLQSAVVFPYIQLSELKTHHTELEKVQREIADKVRPEVEEQWGAKFPDFDVLSYKTLDSGDKYFFMKIQLGVLQVKAIQGEDGYISFQNYKYVPTKDPIEYF
ncbi:uncharacterized protein LOC142349225 [Convolutriloba macropyga]|uniref:uncharacterized protein LOC142349225 n=1 Tax=Convolutriloba macropyga TaxID=536237 RepID=UPI003F527488